MCRGGQALVGQASADLQRSDISGSSPSTPSEWPATTTPAPEAPALLADGISDAILPTTLGGLGSTYIAQAVTGEHISCTSEVGAAAGTSGIQRTGSVGSTALPAGRQQQGGRPTAARDILQCFFHIESKHYHNREMLEDVCCQVLGIGGPLRTASKFKS